MEIYIVFEKKYFFLINANDSHYSINGMIKEPKVKLDLQQKIEWETTSFLKLFIFDEKTIQYKNRVIKQKYGILVLLFNFIYQRTKPSFTNSYYRSSVTFNYSLSSIELDKKSICKIHKNLDVFDFENKLYNQRLNELFYILFEKDEILRNTINEYIDKFY